MSLPLGLILLGILIGLTLHGGLGVALVVIGLVLLIWPHVRGTH